MIVLNYHELTGDGSHADLWTLTREDFDAHLALWADKLITPADFLARCQDKAAARAGDVLLTFDDAFLSDYEYAYGVHMQAGRIPGFMSFLPVDHVGAPGRMTWEMIEEMDRNGVLIGSHGLAHVDLTSISGEALRRELATSKATIEDRLGHEVAHLAFPFGKFNRTVWEGALEAGYTHLYTIQHGHHNGFEPFLYSRLCMTHTMDGAYMQAHLANPDQARGAAWRISSSLGLYRALMRWRFR